MLKLWVLPVLGCLVLGSADVRRHKLPTLGEDPGFAERSSSRDRRNSDSPDSTVRRVAEDEMVRQMGPERAVAAYTLLDENDRQTWIG